MTDETTTEAQIDVPRYLAGIKDEIWCIVKLPASFPALRRGGDLDIFCYRLERVGRRLLALARHDVETRGLEATIAQRQPDHWHLDLIEDGDIVLRFDLYGAMPRYRRLRVKPALFESIIEHAEPRTGEHQGRVYVYHVPCALDEALIRYLEYCEYYWTGLDKLHHLDWIAAQLDEEPRRIGFLDKLHRYSAFPDYEEQLATEPPSLLRRYAGKLRRTPVHLWPAKAGRQFRRVLKRPLGNDGK